MFKLIKFKNLGFITKLFNYFKSKMSLTNLNTSKELFQRLNINLDEVPLEYLADYTAITYFLTIEESSPSYVSNLEKVRKYLESFYHLCQIKDWQRSLIVLQIEPEAKIQEELHNLLGIWGYHEQQKMIYQDLLYKVNPQCDATCLTGLGNVYDTQGNYSLAIEYHTKQLELAQEIGDDSGEWIALVGLGNVQKALGHFQDSLTYFHQALDIARQIKDIRGEVIALGSLGNIYMGLNNNDESKEYTENCLTLAQQHQFSLFEARAAIILGNISRDENNVQEALNWYHHGLEIAQELDDIAVIIDAMRSLGDSYEELGNSLEALEWLHKSLEIAQEFGDKAIEAESWRGLGNAYATLGNLEQAIFYYQKRLDFLELTEDKANIASNLQGLALAYDKLNRLAEAIKYEEKRLKILTELEDWEKVADSHAYLGYAHLGLNNYYEALANLMAALALQKEQGNQKGKANTLYNLAELMAHLDQITPALQLCQEGLTVAQECDLELVEEFKELQELIEAYSRQLIEEEDDEV
uniref:TPR repeat-containing protein n=2 Tax=Gloeothece TaxID=28070 RepID=E0UM17_GLOV7|nr:TPR repeat-containing protein [Gloeothece verrucosa PCC 7822]